MSNALAIAAVTAVLKDLLNNGLINHDLPSHLGPVKVTALPPDRIKLDEAEPSQLNLFMYQATPNAAWRNVDLPSRDLRGERVSNPPLALDLHYLLTAYGAEELHGEILLGYALQILHEFPVLGREAIRTALASPSPVEPSTVLPEPLKSLSAAELADQVEMIKILPQALSPEEISRLWSAFQAHYRPTAAYQASVVLIERQRARKSALPVLTVGPGGRGVAVQPDLVPPFPALAGVILPRGAGALLDDVLELEGHHLDGSEIRIRFTHPRLRIVLEAGPAPGSTDKKIPVKLREAVEPGSPAALPEKAWAAGFYTAAVLVKRPGEPYSRMTNEISFPVAPSIQLPVQAVKGPGEKVTLTVKCRPEVRPEQQASLIVEDREIPAEPHASPADTLSFIAAIPPGKYWVRLRVDGVDSLLADRTKTPPLFDPDQQVTIP